MRREIASDRGLPVTDVVVQQKRGQSDSGDLLLEAEELDKFVDKYGLENRAKDVKLHVIEDKDEVPLARGRLTVIHARSRQCFV